MQEQENGGPEPSRPDPLAERVWRIVGPGLEVVALLAAYQQHETLAVVARVLMVLGQSTVVALAGERHR